MKFSEILEARVFARRGVALFLSFIFGFVVRLVPEVLLSPYPIGYDAIWYAWRIRTGVVWFNWTQVFSTWLLYGLLVPLYNATQLNLFGLLKFSAALLFGFDACGVYYFATKALNWTRRKALFASVFFSLQAAVLLMSAAFYRNMLGLGILIFTLPLLKDDLKSTKWFAVFALLSVLVVLSHEFVTVIFFTVVLGFLLTRFLKGSSFNVKRHLLAIIPAFALLILVFYFMAFPVVYPVQTNIITLQEPAGNYHGLLFLFSNYLAVREIGQQYDGYLGLTSQVFLFFAALYILILPFVLVGFFRDVVLSSWTVLVLLCSFGAVVMPTFAPILWDRWMFMLVFPFAFFAVNGMERFLRFGNRSVNLVGKQPRWMNLSKKAVKVLFVIFPIVCGLFFAAEVIPTQASFVPVSDFADTVKALNWVNTQMGNSSVLLVHFAFQRWSEWCLNGKQVCLYFNDDIEGALNLALERGFKVVYFVWWTDKVGWFNLAVPRGFSSVFRSGRISVFDYSK